MHAQRVENKENNIVENALKAAEVPASTVIKVPFTSNLMVLTQSVKTREDDRKNAEGVVKPENDPFWNDRCAEKDARLACNPTSAAIRANAVSKLLQPTSAYLSGARKKVDEEAVQKSLEEKTRASFGHRVKAIGADSGVLRPTVAYRQHKTTNPEPSEPSDETVARTLNEFGNVKTFNRRCGGTIGFGMTSAAVPAASGTMGSTMELPGQATKKELTQPVVSQRLLVPTSASRAATYAKHKEETMKKYRTWTTPMKRPAHVPEAAFSRIANLAVPVYRLTHQAEAMRSEDAVMAKVAAPRERSWNSVTCNAKSLQTAYERANRVCSDNTPQAPITAAVAPMRAAFTPTVFRAFSVADKPTAATAFRNRGSGVASTVAEQLVAKNEESLAQQMNMHRVGPSSRASLGGFSNIMRPTAASTSNMHNRRSSMLPAPPAQIPVQMQSGASVVNPEVVASVMPPAPPVEVVTKKAVIKVETPMKMHIAAVAPVIAAPAVVEAKKEAKTTAVPMVDGDELVMTAEEASLYADIVASTMASLTSARASTLRAAKSPSTSTMQRRQSMMPKSPKSAKKATLNNTTPVRASTPKTIGSAKRTPGKFTPAKSPVTASTKASIKKSPRTSAPKSPKSPRSGVKSVKKSPKKSPSSASTPKAAAKTPKSARKTIMSTPVAVPAPPSPLSAPSSAPRSLTRMSASKIASANKSAGKLDISSHVASLTQDVAALLEDSPHVMKAAAITPPLTRGAVPKFDESPLTPAEIKRSSRRVTRSLAAKTEDMDF